MAVNSLVVQSFLFLAIFGLTYSAVTINRFSLLKADEAFTCYACDATDPTCKNIQTDGGVQCSETETGCGILIDSEGLTVRKCGQDCTEAECDICADQADCNSYVFPLERRQCHQCDSTTAGCTSSELTGSTASPCLKYVADDNCYSAIEAGVLYRGCESDVAEKCTANANCVKCTNEIGCNSVVGSSDFTCKACENCGTTAQVDKTCSVDFGSDSCAHSITDGLVFKGCAADCAECTKCQGSNCNNQLYCVTCDSDTTPTCLTNPALSSSTLCSAGATCITATSTTGNTIRGCSDAVTETNSDPCSTDQCNKNVYPTDRPSCYQCSGADCLASQLEGLTPTVCSKYVAEDECYTLVKDNIVSRGCLSDITDNSCTGNEECVLCTGAGCNIVAGTQKVQCQLCENCDKATPSTPISCAVDFGADTCYNSITATGEINKGCAKECTGAECSYCQGVDCNDQLYCLACDSTDAACIAGTGIPNSTPCPKGQQCLTGIGATGNTVRGCETVTADPQELCVTDKCNNGPYPTDRLSCYQCTGASCVMSELESLSPTECAKYVANDQCYTLVKDNVISRGCISDITDNSCTDNVECIPCTGAGCNTVVGTQNVQCQLCADCDEDTPSTPTSCAVDFGAEHTCYNSISATGEIAKGCAKECTGAACSFCQGADCNDRLYCLKCASTVDDHCITGAENPSTDACDKGLKCLSGIDATGNTIRGCENSITSDPQELCATDKCNTGLYPTERLSCHQCTDCTSDTLLPAGHEYCKLYKENDECYLLVSEDGESITRGCVSGDSTCAENDHCISCPASGCNSQVEQQYCVQCEGNDCLTGLVAGTVCPSGASLSYEQCYTYNNQETVVRGCIASAADDVKAVCNDPEDNKCTLCIGASCNNAPETIYSTCVVCDSRNDENCDENLSTLSNACAVTDAKCFLYRKGATEDDAAIVQRGCVDADTPAECATGTSECKTCEGNDCNAKIDFQSCHVCDDCTLIPTTGQTICEEYLAKCNVYIDTESRQTIRACTSSSVNLPEGTLVSECEENNCNNKIFPEERLLCHQCDTDVAACQTIAAGAVGSPCNLYKEDDTCYNYLDTNKMVRGCNADANFEKCILAGETINCKECSTSNCNTDAILNAPTLKCIKCEADDVACAWGYPLSSSALCTTTIPFLSANTESCYTTQTDNKVTRGCLLDDEVTVCDETNSCVQCTDEGCNNVNIDNFKCIQCDSSVEGQASCSNSGNDINIAATDCTGTMEYEKRGCYTMKNTNVIRGCNSALEEAEYETCTSSDTSCILCNNEPGCNGNGAAGLSVLSGTMLLGVAYLIKLLF